MFCILLNKERKIIMLPKKTALWDSVSLNVINTDKFKTAMIFFSLRTKKDKSFAADRLLLPGILRRGTVEYPSAARLNLELDNLYASTVEIKLSHLGKNELLTFSAEMLDNSFVTDGTDILDGVVKIIAEMILHPITDGESFPADTVKKERASVLDSLKAEINNPKTYAAARCAELLHGADPEVSSIGELIDGVEKTDGASTYRVYRNILEHAALDVYYVGALDGEQVADSIKRHFATFKPNATPAAPVSAEHFTKLKEVTEPFPVSQSKLSLGFRVGVCSTDRYYYAAILFNEIFGGSPASKLFMNVRERMGLCYYCSSHYDSYFGNITVSSGVDSESAELAKAEILAQLEDMKAGRISEVEFSAAKLAFEHYCRQTYDYPFDIFTFYRSRGVLGIETTLEEHLKNITAVTLDEVVAVANFVKLDTVYLLRGTLSAEGEEEYDE